MFTFIATLLTLILYIGKWTQQTLARCRFRHFNNIRVEICALIISKILSECWSGYSLVKMWPFPWICIDWLVIHSLILKLFLGGWENCFKLVLLNAKTKLLCPSCNLYVASLLRICRNGHMQALNFNVIIKSYILWNLNTV